MEKTIFDLLKTRYLPQSRASVALVTMLSYLNNFIIIIYITRNLICKKYVQVSRFPELILKKSCLAHRHLLFSYKQFTNNPLPIKILQKQTILMKNAYLLIFGLMLLSLTQCSKVPSSESIALEKCNLPGKFTAIEN